MSSARRLGCSAVARWPPGSSVDLTASLSRSRARRSCRASNRSSLLPTTWRRTAPPSSAAMRARSQRAGVIAVLVHEGGRGGQYADPVAAADRLISLLDLGRGDAIRAGEQRPEEGSERAARVLPDPHERSAGARLEQRRREPRVCVAVGEEATVRQQAGPDHSSRILARSPALDPPSKELEADDARVVEGDDDGRFYRPRAPQRLDEVGPLVGRIRVFKRFVGIAVPDVIEEEAVGVASLGELRIHLCPAEGPIRPPREERERRAAAGNVPDEHAQPGAVIEPHALRIVGQAFAAREPLLCAD